MSKNGKQIRKRFFLLLSAAFILIAMRPEYVEAAGRYTSDWQRWSQGASAYSAMQYGCRVTAYAKMLAEAGYTGFHDPDGFFEWGKGNGYFRASDTAEYNAKMPYAPVDYVNSNGGTASYVGSKSLSQSNARDADTVMSLINQGYYVVLISGPHSVYVGREASLSQGTPVLLDSWKSREVGPSFQYKNYTTYTFTQARYYRISDNDRIPPVISNVSVTGLSSDGYTVQCTVTDNVGVDRVEFPTWTDSGGQDDLLWKKGTQVGNTYSFYVDVKDHNNEEGYYATHIYAWDKSGNSSNTHYGSGLVYVDRTAPRIYDVNVTDVNTEGYTVTCRVEDAHGVARVQFPSWTEYNGQDDLTSNWWDNPSCKGTQNGSLWTFRVKDKDHNFERGTYRTHIYAYDDSGNNTCYKINNVELKNTYAQINAVSYGEHTYRLYNDCLTWDEARKKCEELGGHLLTITSAEEQQAVESLVSGQGRAGYWIGGSKGCGSTWVTGEAFSYTNWHEGEPNEMNGEDSYGIYTDSLKWNDWMSYGPGLGFICEWENAKTEKPQTGGTAAQPDKNSGEDAGFANKEYIFETIDGKRVSTKASGEKATVLIFGRATCGNSQYTVSSVEQSEWAGSEEIRVLFAEFDQAGLEKTKEFAQSCGQKNLEYCYSDDNSIRNALGDYLFAAGIRGTVQLPVVVIIDSNDRVRSVETGNRTADELLAVISVFTEVPFEAKGDPDLEISVSGVQNYEYAKEIVKLTNEIRSEKGLAPLGLDEELTEAAMQRAAETALYYGHTRPDGRECFTVLKRGNIVKENIAVGYKSPQDVVDGWRNSSGHYANMINESVKSIGIGCFQDSQGTWYWVQYFDNASTQAMKKSGEETVTKSVLIKRSMLNLMPAGGKNTVKIGCSVDSYEGKFDVATVNQGWNPSRPTLPSSEFTFESSNPAVAEINAEGTITVKAAGTAVLTAKLKADPTLYTQLTAVKAGHQYESRVVSPTKKKEGYTLHTCKECGDSYKDSFVPKLQGKNEESGKNPGASKDTGNGKTQGSGGNSGVLDAQGAKAARSIKAKNITKTYGAKTFSLGAKASGGGKLTYSVSDRKVATISKTGKVSIKGCGVTKITIKAAADKNYSAAKKTVTLTVKPKQQTVASLKSRKAKTLTVKWKKDAKATGYILQYSTDKKFKKSVKSVTVKKNTATSKTLSKLKGGRKYYVRVCSYKTSGGKQIKGAYSKVKAVTVRR